MRRRASREHAMKLLYQLHVHKDGTDELVSKYFEESGDAYDTDYIKKVIYGVIENKNQITEIITSHLKGWKLSRIPKVDLAILELAICEILRMNDIPHNVSINEAVEIAKKYSCTKSASFINGVLSGVVRSLKQTENRQT